MTPEIWPSIDELHADFLERYGDTWLRCWELGDRAPLLEGLFMLELGAGAGLHEPADYKPLPAWQHDKWLSVLGALALQPLAAGDRFTLRERARVLNRTDKARAAGLID